ncbi:MAG TPA: translesion error-prone DNA polymerase V autoproteolytic subunit [Victivallales bacterium]|nr:translesion error-prone DNA polymerase V autoproteolytic subunit [Victivallales bacterium]
MKINTEKEKLIFFTSPPILSEVEIPIATEHVSAGFPSPAENYMDGPLDLNKHLIKNPPATFFVRVDGDSMVNAGIQPGDILIVDRSVEAQNNDVIIAVINGEFTVKRLIVKNDVYILQPENPKYKSLIITDTLEFEIWGKVISLIHNF